ncbi:hypothetical protein [Dermatobacter hominis]|uniref:hypothetical protein n=1 Tax=Dermatobacter hominis TaxID=2884263 RepID=UPI001D121CDA|nr:hypothetical protein [Dermatobacter hominis]UDY35997.1 hypothetical protein LH044_00320 [Dermatobacter hominis]
MHKPADLINQAATVLAGIDEPIRAAGIFGHANPSNLELAVAGGAAASVPGSSDPLLGAVANVTAMQAVATADAARDGLTVRMLLAVTDSRIFVLDWATGDGATRVLATLDRATTDIEVRHFGLSRRVELTDHASGRVLHLVGATAAFSPEAAGDKAVLRVLDPS